MDDGNGMEYAECDQCGPEPAPLTDLELAEKMLDEVIGRIDYLDKRDTKDPEYLKSGIRTAKHHIFQAMKEL